MSPVAADAATTTGSRGAVQVLLDLRDRWLLRGVDWWSDDPTRMEGGGWIRLDDLTADPDRIRDAVSGYGDALGVDDRKAAASLLVKRLGSILAFPPTVAWMDWRRVPTMLPDRVWMRFADGKPARICVPDPEVRVLADDPLAGRAGVFVADEDALMDRLLADAYTGTMGSIFDAVHRVERTGRRHLWGNLALTAINSSIWCTRNPDPWADGWRLLQSRTELARTAETLPRDDEDAGRYLVALRKTCCMAYADPGHGYCASCSLLDRDERIEDLTVRIGEAWRNRRRDV